MPIIEPPDNDNNDNKFNDNNNNDNGWLICLLPCSTRVFLLRLVGQIEAWMSIGAGGGGTTGGKRGMSDPIGKKSIIHPESDGKKKGRREPKAYYGG